METPLTPLDFARRARKLYGDREAVVDGELRLTYAQFFDRIDRWSSAIQRLGILAGDRIAYLAPNAHADYLAAVDSIRSQIPGVEHFVALEGERAGWLDYEALVKEAQSEFDRPE